MSLINEALKKAQRQRTDQQPGAPMGQEEAGTPIVKRGKPMRAQALLLLATGAAVLIVFSVVITVYLVNREPPQLATPAPVAAKPLIQIEDSTPTPIIVAPTIALPAAPTSVEIAPAPEPMVATTVAAPAATPRAQPSEVVPTSSAPATAATEPKTSLPTVPAATAPETVARTPVPGATFDARVIAFVDSIRVTGIRSSGNESKVLMNDRVYRVNDIVDRGLSLQLIKVESDMLTFTDANGIVYTKNF